MPVSRAPSKSRGLCGRRRMKDAPIGLIAFLGKTKVACGCVEGFGIFFWKSIWWSQGESNP